MKALIIGNGSEIEKTFTNKMDFDYIVCADGGLEKAKKHGIMPNLIIGDFDSVNLSLLEEYRLKKVAIEKFPAEKDFTDMELAVKFVISKGYKNIVLAAATGTRLDHTMGNIMLLEKYYKEGIDITIVDNNNEIKIITDNSQLIIDFKENHYISIIPLTDTKGLTMEGFKYPLSKVDVQRGSTLCISNEISEKQGKITLNKGAALVFISKD
ncbi:MAG: thiamine diphosphokinase [Tissierellia bacterium]|nr:thiamine diphosphokinase [Tissierellia bacterium]